jgi:DNA topoisomerase I
MARAKKKPAKKKPATKKAKPKKAKAKAAAKPKKKVATKSAAKPKAKAKAKPREASKATSETNGADAEMGMPVEMPVAEHAGEAHGGGHEMMPGDDDVEHSDDDM